VARTTILCQIHQEVLYDTSLTSRHVTVTQENVARSPEITVIPDVLVAQSEGGSTEVDAHMLFSVCSYAVSKSRLQDILLRCFVLQAETWLRNRPDLRESSCTSEDTSPFHDRYCAARSQPKGSGRVQIADRSQESDNSIKRHNIGDGIDK